MRRALHAEWTKLRTTASTGWLLLAVAVSTAGLSALVVVSASCDSVTCTPDTTKMSLSGVDFGQAIAAILGVIVVGNEYSSGMIRTSLAAVPRRIDVLAAKAVTVGGLVTLAGAIGVLGSLLAGRLVLPGRGFTAARGFAALSLTHGSTLRAAAGSTLYLALVALLGLGIATLVRETAVAIGLVLGLLYLFPILLSVVSDPAWQRHLQQIAPMNAGLAVQVTVGVHGLPIAPWAGLGVLAAWAAGTLVVAGLVLRVRDA